MFCGFEIEALIVIFSAFLSTPKGIGTLHIVLQLGPHGPYDVVMKSHRVLRLTIV